MSVYEATLFSKQSAHPIPSPSAPRRHGLRGLLPSRSETKNAANELEGESSQVSPPASAPLVASTRPVVLQKPRAYGLMDFVRQPSQTTMAVHDHAGRLKRLALLAGVSAAGLGVVVGSAALLGHFVTHHLLQLTVSGGGGEGIAAQLYILGDALTFLFGQGGGIFGNMATVATMSALTRAIISRGDPSVKRNSWLMAQTTLGLSLSPIFATAAPMTLPVVASLVGAMAAMTWVVSARALSRVEPSERTLLLGVACGVALAPIASKIALGQPLMQVLGDAAQIPIIVLAGLALWDFWQHFQFARQTPASSHPELDLTAPDPDLWPGLERPGLPALVHLPKPPAHPHDSVVGLDRITNLASGVQSALIDWFGHKEQRPDRRRHQWLFCGPSGTGKKTTIRALQNYFNALLLETSPDHMPSTQDEGAKGGRLVRLVERAEYLARKNPSRMVILAIHHVEGFLAAEAETPALSSTNSSDLLKALEFNEVENKRLAPVMIICTSSQEYALLPARLRDRMEERYSFLKPTADELRVILQQKIRSHLKARPHLSRLVLGSDNTSHVLLPSETLLECSEQASQAHLTGDALNTYAWRLVNRVAMQTTRAPFQSPSVSDDDATIDFSLQARMAEEHAVMWPEFLAEKAQGLSPSPSLLSHA